VLVGQIFKEIGAFLQICTSVQYVYVETID